MIDICNKERASSLFEYDKTLVHDVHENLKEGLDYWKKEK